MCDRLAVMRNAQMVETLTREALRAREINSEYTRALVAAS
jgi:peptide/nickel transport system ATP-binding protein